MSIYYVVFKDDVRVGRPLEFGEITYVPERTCRWELVEGTLFATECGEAFHRVVPDDYCPNCGAKVVDE